MEVAAPDLEDASTSLLAVELGYLHRTCEVRLDLDSLSLVNFFHAPSFVAVQDDRSDEGRSDKVDNNIDLLIIILLNPSRWQLASIRIHWRAVGRGLRH